MKVKNILLSCVGLAVLCALCYEAGWAGNEKPVIQPKVAVVKIREAFQSCEKHAEYQKNSTAEQGKVMAELEKLSKEVDALKADLNTRKPGTDDYLTLMQETVNKQAEFQAKQEFQRQRLSLKDQQWTEQLYTQILEAVAKIAKEKGIDMVFTKDEVDFPAAGATELMLIIRTNKLLYCSDSLDITNDVLAVLNAQK